MVANHQGGGHQGAMSSNTAMLSRSRANQCPVSGVKQPCRRNLETAEFDPNQTLSSPDPVQSGSGFTRVVLECSILPAVLALGVARARPPASPSQCPTA